MPRKIRIARVQKTSNLTIDQLEHLIHGWCLDGCQPDYGHLAFPFRDESHRKECWKKNKKYIMSFEGAPPQHDVSFFGLSFPRGKKPAAWKDYEY